MDIYPFAENVYIPVLGELYEKKRCKTRLMLFTVRHHKTIANASLSFRPCNYDILCPHTHTRTKIKNTTHEKLIHLWNIHCIAVGVMFFIDRILYRCVYDGYNFTKKKTDTHN